MTRTHTYHESSLGRLTLVMDEHALAGVYYPHHWYKPVAATFGALTGYAGGIDRKRSLLEMEWRVAGVAV